MPKAGSPSHIILRTASARADITRGELCRMACIPSSTLHDHLRGGGLTQAEIQRIDRVVHFTDDELIGLIRGTES